MVSPVSSIGPDEIDTLAVSPAADAISVSCAEPVGGLNVVCVPAISEMVPPPVIDHVIAASLFDSFAVKLVGDDTLNAPVPEPLGEIVKVGPLSVPPHAPSAAPKNKIAATLLARISLLRSHGIPRSRTSAPRPSEDSVCFARRVSRITGVAGGAQCRVRGSRR